MSRREELARVTRLNEALEDVLPSIEKVLDDEQIIEELRFVKQGLGDLESELGRAVWNQRGQVCPECSQRFTWPGELEAHTRLHHPDLWEACAA